MRSKNSLPPLWLSLAAASLVLIPALTVRAQSTEAKADSTVTGKSVQAKTAVNAPQPVDRAKAYFHAAMANMYEEEAVTTGQPEFVTHAIEEYKDALNADPDSAAVERRAGRPLLPHRPHARGRSHRARAAQDRPERH